jgi:hypothetical protein
VAVRLRRDFGAVLNLIRGNAILHQASRERDAEGRIIATLKDYAVVRDLVADLVSESVEATVPATVRETVEKLRLLCSDESDPVTIVKLAEELELDKSTAWRRVRTAIDRGYVKNLEDRKGRPAQLVPGERLPDDVEILPTVERLQAYPRGLTQTFLLMRLGMRLKKSSSLTPLIPMQPCNHERGTGVRGHPTPCVLTEWEARMKRERGQPTRSEGYIPPLPQKRPVGELVAESKPAIFGEAEEVEFLVVHKLRVACLPVVHLNSVQLLLEGCRLGRVAGVSVTSTHGPLRTHLSGVEGRRYLPSGPFLGWPGDHIAGASQSSRPESPQVSSGPRVKTSSEGSRGYSTGAIAQRHKREEQLVAEELDTYTPNGPALLVTPDGSAQLTARSHEAGNFSRPRGSGIKPRSPTTVGACQGCCSSTAAPA